MIEVSSLTLVPGTILYRKKQRGEFAEAGEHERLVEMQEFIKKLTNKTFFLSDHISVPFHVRAKLPKQKEELISGVQKIIDKVPEEELEDYRKANPIM